MTKYWTATYIGLTPMTFLWGVTQVTDYLTRMHTAHLANVSKSVTKNATFPRTGGLPCLITHSCMSATSPTVVGGLIFCISATPHPGSLFPLFHASGVRPGQSVCPHRPPDTGSPQSSAAAGGETVRLSPVRL